jgi:transcriptional regulator with XRE-family HTH domain
MSADGTDLFGLGPYLRAQRRLANLSLRQMADLAGVSNPYLSQIERGLHEPSVRILRSIAEALNLSAETVLEQAGLLSRDDTLPTSTETPSGTTLTSTRTRNWRCCRFTGATERTASRRLGRGPARRARRATAAPSGGEGARTTPSRSSGRGRGPRTASTSPILARHIKSMLSIVGAVGAPSEGRLTGRRRCAWISVSTDG